MTELVFLVEEPSAKELLRGLIPRIVDEQKCYCRYVVFEGKQDLDKSVQRKLKGYLKQDAIFIILRDQDSDDCKFLKARLREQCELAGKPGTLIRIACRELESWYLADLSAVEKSLGMTGLQKHQKSKKFRSPDQTQNPSKELIEITKHRYQKISGSRTIAPLLDLDNTRSTSFNNFVKGIRRLVQGP
jgi:hypothetical protein